MKALYINLVLVLNLMMIAPVQAQPKQGDCAWAMQHAVNPSMKFAPHYKCWYGLSTSQKISVVNSSVIRTDLNAKSKKEILGKITTNRNLIFTYEGNDEIFGSGNVDWIYPGLGTNKIHMLGHELTMLTDGSSNTIYLCDNAQRAQISNLQPGDKVIVDSSNAFCPVKMKPNEPDVTTQNFSNSDCPCDLETVYVDGEGIINDYTYTRCPCKPVEIGSDDWVRSQGWDPMRH